MEVFETYFKIPVVKPKATNTADEQNSKRGHIKKKSRDKRSELD